MSIHKGIIGQSLSGKSTLGLWWANQLKKRGRRIVVLDPIGDLRWSRVADVVTKDPLQFLAIAQHNQSCHLFADEWGIAIGPYAQEFDWLGTTSRHHGHMVWIIAHRWQQISTTLRDNIGRAFLFCQGVKSAAMVAEEFAKPQLAAQLLPLEKGKFFEVERCRADIRSGKINFSTKSVKLA